MCKRGRGHPFHITGFVAAARSINKINLQLIFYDFQATLLAIRQVHRKLYLRIRESEAQHMMAVALSEAGLQDGECLTLFGGMSGSSPPTQMNCKLHDLF